jgi:hypothetical protein
MAETAELQVVENSAPRKPKDKSNLIEVIVRHREDCGVDGNQPVLVLGGGQEDLDILAACGFKQIVISNIDSHGLALDAENIELPDNSYPVVFAHAVLHHCRSPHKALGEMVRVAQQHVFFLEPNDSWALRMLVRLGYSFPYELAAVAANEYLRGGLRDGPIPNYIYRWTGREVEKSIASYHPERQFQVRAHPYWDFYVNEYELLKRNETRVAQLAERIGPRNLMNFLHLGQAVLNLLPPVRSQGNKFFCAISKRELHPWIEVQDGHCHLKKENERLS